jgi:ubiquitin-conjugating enzyme (huntingtin interacting protein 2)
MSSIGSRLSKELAEVCKDDKTSGVKAVVIDEKNNRHLKGTIQGPEGTPYEGGVWEIDIDIPKQYPFEPPKMKFITKIWHPNISSQTGAICLVRLFAFLCGDASRHALATRIVLISISFYGEAYYS